MRRAVIDLGSNTFHVLVADVDDVGVRNVIFDRKISTRIGAFAFARSRIPEDAYRLGLAALGNLIERTRLPHERRIVATGVFRDAHNAAAFLAEARERYHIDIEVLAGDEEARLTWLGVSAELAGSHERLALVDVGGGSLELAIGRTRVDYAASLPLGALRMRHWSLPTVRDTVLRAARDHVESLQAYGIDTLAISSGTARALLKVGRRLGLLSQHQRHLGWRIFGQLATTLAGLDSDALDALGVEASRHDTLAIGAAIFDVLLRQLGCPLVYVAHAALREGVLVDLARRDELRPAAAQFCG